MNGAAFIKAFREETVDEAQPPLWSDPLILRYLDEAQTTFCQMTEGIEDSLSSVCTVVQAEGEAQVRLSSKIQKLRAASVDYSGQPGHARTLELMSLEEARQNGVPLVSTARGMPRALIQGLGKGYAQLYPAPAQDITLRLDVFRLPLKPIDSPASVLEVPDKHAPALMLYALYRAYSRPDPDTMDRTRADYFHERFVTACDTARREQGRARKPNGATQFSW